METRQYSTYYFPSVHGKGEERLCRSATLFPVTDGKIWVYSCQPTWENEYQTLNKLIFHRGEERDGLMYYSGAMATILCFIVLCIHTLQYAQPKGFFTATSALSIKNLLNQAAVLAARSPLSNLLWGKSSESLICATDETISFLASSVLLSLLVDRFWCHSTRLRPWRRLRDKDGAFLCPPREGQRLVRSHVDHRRAQNQEIDKEGSLWHW